MIQIDSPITGYEVVKEGEEAPMPSVRPEVVCGETYKIKTPTSDHALYVTINDVEVNGQIRPFEVFINSKNMEHYQWIVAFTRLASAVFRKGGECAFLVEELRSVFDPQGGYFKKGGRYMPSLVAEIGDVIERHLIAIGLVEPAQLDASLSEYVEKKKAEHAPAAGEYPAHASVCAKCFIKAVVVMDGCATCLACADSKCG